MVFEEMRVGKKLLALSTMYIQKRKKSTSNANASSNTSETLSTSSDFQESENAPENQEKNSRLRFLLRQDRTENPVIWASIVLAKEIFLGRKITAAKLETVLPSSKFDGTKREYAVSRAKEIADRYRINKEKFGEKLDVGLQRAESDLYWRKDVMDEMYASFRADGEEYGYIKARLKEWLKNERRRDLENIKGLSSDEIGVDVADAIENAIDAEPNAPSQARRKRTKSTTKSSKKSNQAEAKTRKFPTRRWRTNVSTRAESLLKSGSPRRKSQSKRISTNFQGAGCTATRLWKLSPTRRKHTEGAARSIGKCGGCYA